MILFCLDDDPLLGSVKLSPIVSGETSWPLGALQGLPIESVTVHIMCEAAAACIGAKLVEAGIVSQIADFSAGVVRRGVVETAGVEVGVGVEVAVVVVLGYVVNVVRVVILVCVVGVVEDLGLDVELCA